MMEQFFSMMVTMALIYVACRSLLDWLDERAWHKAQEEWARKEAEANASWQAFLKEPQPHDELDAR